MFTEANSSWWMWERKFISVVRFVFLLSTWILSTTSCLLEWIGIFLWLGGCSGPLRLEARMTLIEPYTMEHHGSLNRASIKLALEIALNCHYLSMNNQSVTNNLSYILRRLQMVMFLFWTSHALASWVKIRSTNPWPLAPSSQTKLRMTFA